MRLLLAAILILSATAVGGGDAPAQEFVIVSADDLRLLLVEFARLQKVAATLGCI